MNLYVWIGICFAAGFLFLLGVSIPAYFLFRYLRRKFSKDRDSAGYQQLSYKGKQPTPLTSSITTADGDVFWINEYPPYPTGDLREVPLQPTNRQLSRISNVSGITELGSVDPEIYELYGTPSDSLDPGEEVEETVANLGCLTFSLRYEEDASLLTVHLMKGMYLCQLSDVDDADGVWCKLNDPYAVLQVVPLHKHQLQSRVHRTTNNPIFDERFEFEVSLKDLIQQTLWVTIMSFDRFSRHENIGQTFINLSQMDISQEVIYTKDLQPVWRKEKSLGDIMFSIGYLRTAGRLTIVVMKGRNLPRMTVRGTDPFVKVALIKGGRRIKKKKTSTKKTQLNPVWNEALTFDVSVDALDNIDLLISVVHQNEVLGCVLLGNNAEGPELQHWQDMRSADKPVARWHELQDGHHFY